nr:hypothetical protein [uncultured Brevundimonas sp.]
MSNELQGIFALLMIYGVYLKLRAHRLDILIEAEKAARNSGIIDPR